MFLGRPRKGEITDIGEKLKFKNTSNIRWRCFSFKNNSNLSCENKSLFLPLLRTIKINKNETNGKRNKQEHNKSDFGEQ